MIKPTFRLLLGLLLLSNSGELKAQINTWNTIQLQQQDIAHVHGTIQSDQAFTIFQRLPNDLQPQLRPAVWSLGTNSAGLYIDFATAADSIKVAYQVSGPLSMPHMPSIGVSGVDLYQKDGDNWNWAYGSYAFKDTISYEYFNINKQGEKKYRLYLPLYNTVKQLQISVPNGQKIQFLKEEENPIIIYGTSITQGACATRPGLAWTNILGRQLNVPIVNLGFSGNGRLEQPILDLMSQAKARIYVLDCIPNLGSITNYPDTTLAALLDNAVKTIRLKNPKTPIILTEHSSGDNGGFINYIKNAEYMRTSHVLKNQFKALNKKYGNLYLLSNEAIGLDQESTVDYAHPNDIGMMKHAEAYKKLIQKIR